MIMGKAACHRCGHETEALFLIDPATCGVCWLDSYETGHPWLAWVARSEVGL